MAAAWVLNRRSGISDEILKEIWDHIRSGERPISKILGFATVEHFVIGVAWEPGEQVGPVLEDALLRHFMEDKQQEPCYSGSAHEGCDLHNEVNLVLANLERITDAGVAAAFRASMEQLFYKRGGGPRERTPEGKPTDAPTD